MLQESTASWNLQGCLQNSCVLNPWLKDWHKDSSVELGRSISIILQTMHGEKHFFFSPKDFWNYFLSNKKNILLIWNQALQTKVLAWTEIIEALSSHEFTVGERKLLSVKKASSVYLGPQASQITKKWVTEARKLSWSFIKTNLATDTTSPVILLPDTTFSHISLPCSLVSSWSHSLHHFGHIVDFFPCCKNFHLIHQVTGRGECSDWPILHFFFN